MKSIRLLAALGLVAVLVLLVVGPGSSERALDRAERVLVVSVPTLTWDAVAEEQPPALVELLGRSAVASLSVRTIGADTNAGEGYATIGAGNRAAIPPGTASSAFPPDAVVDEEVVSDLYERRFGRSHGDAEVVQVGLAAIQRRNDDLLYGTEVGTLGAALRDAGLSAGIVANADLDEDSFHREAALAVVDDEGLVPVGRVDPGLLDLAAPTPSGLALDPDAVVEAATDALGRADLVLVELSDLLRVQATERVVTPEVAEQASDEAIAATDGMLADLLELVDLDRDLVIVVSPVAPAGPDQLVVAAVAGPGVEPGLARSGTSRRDGYVTLPDLGPTILSVLGIDKPGAMNGAPIASAGGGAPDGATFEALAEDNVKALFRNDLSGPLTVVFIVSQVLTYALGAFALTTGRDAWCRAAAFVLLAGMAIPLTSFLAGLFPYWRLSVLGAVVAILGAAALLALGIRTVVDRRGTQAGDPHVTALDATLVVTAATVAVLVGDIVSGGPLQIDTAFGYGGGAIVAGRLAGYGNLAWALLVTALIITVTALWGRWHLRQAGPAVALRPHAPDADDEVGDADEPEPAPTAVAALPSDGDRRVALVLAGAAFGLCVLAVGMPTLGSNVGGTLSVVSGLCITLLALAGARIDLRRLVYVGLATVGVLGVFGAIDLTRAPEDQTHLGRLIDQTLGDEGLAGLETVIQRKINANLNILTSSVWSFVIPAALGFLAFLTWRPPRLLRQLFRHVPGMQACVVGVLATGAIGGVVNDSGIAIPAIMLTLLLPFVAYVILETHGRAPVAPEEVPDGPDQDLADPDRTGPDGTGTVPGSEGDSDADPGATAVPGGPDDDLATAAPRGPRT